MTRSPGLPPAAHPSRRHAWRAPLALFIALFAYWSLWSCLRPPAQSPDEHHHLAKLLSLTERPWFAASETVPVPAWRWSPLGTDPLPHSLGKLAVDASARLSRDEIAALHILPGSSHGGPSTVEVRTQAAGYPTPGYWLIRAAGEVLMAPGDPGPYRAFYLWRVAAAFASALCWAVAYACWPSREAGSRDLVFGLTLLNPMVPFLSSSVGLDGVHLPLAILAVGWGAHALGTGQGLAMLAAVVTAVSLVSPRGLLVGPALVAALGVAGAMAPPRRRHAVAACAALGLAIGAAWLLFYRADTARVFTTDVPAGANYLVQLAGRLPALWRQFWGKMGWLDYALPAWWYLGLTALLAANAWRARRSPVRLVPRPTRDVWAAFAVALFVATVAVMWMNFPHTVRLQGRYFLPCSVGLALALDHDRPGLRTSLFVWLAAMQVAFVGATVTRYYEDGWRGLFAALPF